MCCEVVGVEGFGKMGWTLEVVILPVSKVGGLNA